MNRALFLAALLLADTASAVIKSLPAGSGGGGGSGTVTSVALTMPSGFTVSGSPITAAGTFGVTFATGQTANRFLATPDGVSGAIGLRALVAGDMPAFSGDIITASGATLATIQPGVVTLAKQANLAATSLIGNSTASSTTPTALNAGQVNTMLTTVMGAYAVVTTSITLSGPQTYDGVSLAVGTQVLVAIGASANNGLYIVQSGAWTRSPVMPAGNVLPQYCNPIVFISNGTVGAGTSYWLSTITSSAVTVGTTSVQWVKRIIAASTSSTLGTVQVSTGANFNVPSLGAPPASVGGNAGDCVAFADATGSIVDGGNINGTLGPCVVSDSSGHPIFSDGTTPSVNVGTVASGSNDNRGNITGLTAQTAVTLTFSAAMPTGVSCVAVPSVATPVAVSVTAISTSAATFTFAAAYTGSLRYICM